MGLTGGFHLLTVDGAFCLVRFETTGPPVWFKAVGPSNVREYAITLGLQSLVPDFVPSVLAARPEWKAWIAFHVQGAPLYTRRDVSAWANAARSLGQMQTVSLAGVGRLANQEARDLRTEWLFESRGEFFDAMHRLMEQQTKAVPARLSTTEIYRLQKTVEDALTEVRAMQVPVALGHLDLNPGNVVLTPNGAVFLDWAEAYIGLPFLSFEYLLEQYRQQSGAGGAAEPRLRKAYFDCWKRLLTIRQIESICGVAPLLSVFAYSASGLSCVGNRESSPARNAYFRSLMRRMALEADRWTARRTA